MLGRPSDFQFLQILQLADSALPIGTLSHSWGLETLAHENAITAETVEALLQGLLNEQFLLEAVFCRAAYRVAEEANGIRKLHTLLSARKPARETREASLTLGRRFVRLFQACTGEEFLAGVEEWHYAIAFGTACGHLGIPEQSCVLALLEQCCASALSSAVRLLPIGHEFASAVLWRMKEHILKVATESEESDPEETPCFCPALEIASMRHPLLETRLFVS